MDKKFTYKHSDGRVTFRRGTFTEYAEAHLDRLETENEPVAAVLKALNELEEKNTPRPILVTGANRSCGECPHCGSYVVDMDGEHYCSSCGQSLSGSTLRKSYKIEISSDCILSIDTLTGERKEVSISRACTVPEIIRAADSILENLIIDFLKAEEQFNKKRTATAKSSTPNAVESGSEDGGNE